MKYTIFITAMFLVACQENVTLADQEVEETDSVSFAVGDAFSMSFDIEKTADRIVKEEVEITDIIETDPETSAAPLDYPPGPYSIEKFKVLPNMTFYNPWDQQWISLSDMYNHDKHKAFILVSSAGWCGPCLSEAAALINIYEKYNVDGLEIIYTLGNTNIPGEVPFDDSRDKSNSGDFHADLKFMENWQLMTQDLANKKLNYKMYADPNREIAKYLPQHAWPLSVLVTTKDMGIRLVEEGYWNALMENKINLVLFNEVPTIPFD